MQPVNPFADHVHEGQNVARRLPSLIPIYNRQIDKMKADKTKIENEQKGLHSRMKIAAFFAVLGLLVTIGGTFTDDYKLEIGIPGASVFALSLFYLLKGWSQHNGFETSKTQKQQEIDLMEGLTTNGSQLVEELLLVENLDHEHVMENLQAADKLNHSQILAVVEAAREKHEVAAEADVKTKCREIILGCWKALLPEAQPVAPVAPGDPLPAVPQRVVVAAHVQAMAPALQLIPNDKLIAVYATYTPEEQNAFIALLPNEVKKRLLMDPALAVDENLIKDIVGKNPQLLLTIKVEVEQEREELNGLQGNRHVQEIDEERARIRNERIQVIMARIERNKQLIEEYILTVDKPLAENLITFFNREKILALYESYNNGDRKKLAELLPAQDREVVVNAFIKQNTDDNFKKGDIGSIWDTLGLLSRTEIDAVHQSLVNDPNRRGKVEWAVQGMTSEDQKIHNTAQAKAQLLSLAEMKGVGAAKKQQEVFEWINKHLESIDFLQLNDPKILENLWALDYKAEIQLNGKSGKHSLPKYILANIAAAVANDLVNNNKKPAAEAQNPYVAFHRTMNKEHGWGTEWAQFKDRIRKGYADPSGKPLNVDLTRQLALYLI